MTQEKSEVVTGLINAGRAMLDRFDRSTATGTKPIRSCRRMREAIIAAQAALQKEAKNEPQQPET